MSMGRRVSVNSVWLIAQPLLLNVITLVAMGFITRRLGKSGYGLFNFGVAWVAVYTPLANLGLRTVAVRAMAQNRENPLPVFAAMLVLRLSLAAIVAALAIGSALWSGQSLDRQWIILMAAGSAVALVLTQSFGDQFRAFEQMRPVALADMVGGLALTGLSVLALAMGAGVLGFTLAYLAGTVIGLGVAVALYVGRFGRPRLRWKASDARELLRQARPFFLMQMVSGVTDKPVLDILLLTRAFGVAAAGPYAAIALLVNRLGIIPQGVTGALFPAVAGGYPERRAEVEQAVRQSILYLAVITLPLAAVVTYLARPLVRIAFGGEYEAAWPVLATLIWVVPLLGPNLLMYDCLSAVHRQDVAARITLLGGLALIGLYAVFIPLYGPIGAAVSALARELVLFGVLFRQMRRSFSDPIPFALLGKAALALAAMGIPMVLVAAAAGRVGSGSSLALQGLAAAVGGGMYALVLLRTRVVNPAALLSSLKAARS